MIAQAISKALIAASLLLWVVPTALAGDAEYELLSTGEALRLVDLSMEHCTRKDRVYDVCETKLIELLIQARDNDKIQALLAAKH